MKILFVVWCLIGWNLATAWNLVTYDDNGLNFITNNNDYEIVHVSVFYVRSFLTIRNRGNASNHHITIIESTWPENLLPIQSRVFPNDLSHAKSPSNCNGIVKTVQTAVDRANGLLWLLDNGSIYCPPKLIVFDLLRNNNEVYRYVFTKLKNDSIKAIQLYAKKESEVDDNAIAQRNANAMTHAIILLHQANFLIQCSLLGHRPYKLTLIIPTNNKPYNVLTPAEITIKNDDELMISDHLNGLWVANLKNVRRNMMRGSKIDLFVEVTFLGSLLGCAKAISIPPPIDGDTNQYLYYYLPRDGAVVRWNVRLPLRAEGHEVLYMARASIVQIVFGAKGSVWVVYEHANELGDHCRRILNFLTFNGPRLML